MERIGIVAFAFGAPGGILSNRQIAEIASQEVFRFDAQLYTQLDVWIDDPDVRIRMERIPEKPGKPPPTLRIARGAVEWAIKQGISELEIVAAPPHLNRCLRDMRFAVAETGMLIRFDICPRVLEYPVGSWFCPESAQHRTSSQKSWKRREWLVWFMPPSIYKLVAS